MITFVHGNIFDSPAQVLCNTVNCVGVMGKGIALDFKQRFPRMFEDYKERCQSQQVKPGIPYLWDGEGIQILNFPTKRHWRDQSSVQDIELGLEYLALNYTELGIHSIAMPPLGCGNGGLEWTTVKSLMLQYLSNAPDLEVFVYESMTPKRSQISLNDNPLAQVDNSPSDRRSALWKFVDG